MSLKINVIALTKEHFSTLVNNKTGKVSIIDIVTFFILPAALSVLSAINEFELGERFIEAIINFGAIFSALLMSVLVLVYDQEKKLVDRKLELESQKLDGLKIQKIEKLAMRHRLLKHLYHNICFSIVSSLLIVGSALSHIVFKSLRYNEINQFIVDPFIIFVLVNMFLTTFMVVKRMHTLLETE